MFIFIAILSCVGVFGYPPYANDVYMRMALERAKDSVYQQQWYNNPYGSDYRYETYDYAPSEGALTDDMEVDAYWPTVEVPVGQVSGVAVDANDNPVVFHRANHPWDPQYQLFDSKNNFLAKEAKAIQVPTVLTLSKEDGSLLNAWGSDKFYMPHGITVDKDGNVWLTDVAMHQVFKFTPGSDEPELVLGKEFEPATDDSDSERFCKPTDVAVSSSGHIFVADGYCNSRIALFDPEGKYLGQFGEGDFAVPHSLALAEDLDLLCVADREDAKILCYNAGLQDEKQLGRLERSYDDPIESKVYAIEYNPETGLLFAVNAPSYSAQGTGYTIDLHEPTFTADIVDVWSPFNNGFTAPHDIAVSSDGNTIYVGEITLEENNMWKFNNVAAQQPEINAGNNAEQTEEIDASEEDEEAEEDGSENIEPNKVDEKIEASNEQVEQSSEETEDNADVDASEESVEEEEQETEEEKEEEKAKEHMAETYERMVDSGIPAAAM